MVHVEYFTVRYEETNLLIYIYIYIFFFPDKKIFM